MNDNFKDETKNRDGIRTVAVRNPLAHTSRVVVAVLLATAFGAITGWIFREPATTVAIAPPTEPETQTEAGRRRQGSSEWTPAVVETPHAESTAAPDQGTPSRSGGRLVHAERVEQIVEDLREVGIAMSVDEGLAAFPSPLPDDR